MAIIWPHSLPPEVTADPMRAAEIRVFQKLERELPDPFVVFYSKPWLKIDSYGNEIDGECDFLIAHPEKGFLVLEVKGGSIEYAPETDIWTSWNRYGAKHEIRNPFKQAVESKYAVIRKLKEGKGIRSRKYFIARHGVVFVDCPVPKEGLGAESPRNIVCDCDQFDNTFEKWILSRFADKSEVDRTESPLGKEGMERLHELFAKPFLLEIPLRNMLEEDETEIETMTRQQFRLLRSIEENPRIAIPGGAGTGKTVLAVREASNCAKKGMRTLFTCYNDGLVAQIRENFRRRHIIGIEVLNFHELCIQFALDARLEIPKEPKNKELKHDYFEETLPWLLSVAVKKISKRFDAIIVDEGQDFRPGWWKPLLETLNPVPESRLRIFYDNNQQLYNESNSLPERLEAAKVRLDENLRNTQRIFRLVEKHYTGPSIDSKTPEGLEINWVELVKENEIQDAILADLGIMLNEEKIAPERIAVLFHSSDEAKRFAKTARGQGMESRICSEISGENRNKITVDTVRRFKGLESATVMLGMTEPLVRDRELIYVAISRAKTFLGIYGPPEILKLVKNPD